VSDPKWLAKAEELAGPQHEWDCVNGASGPDGVEREDCNCPRRERVQAIALALEEAHAEGRKEREAEVAELRKRIETFEESSAADTRCINRWAERYEMAHLEGVKSVLKCYSDAEGLVIRCIQHFKLPAFNATEISGGECGACAHAAGKAEGENVAVARYHRLIQDALALIDPEEHAELTDAMLKALDGCPPACSHPECEEAGYEKGKAEGRREGIEEAVRIVDRPGDGGTTASGIRQEMAKRLRALLSNGVESGK
jgi:hypothetical protein